MVRAVILKSAGSWNLICRRAKCGTTRENRITRSACHWGNSLGTFSKSISRPLRLSDLQYQDLFAFLFASRSVVIYPQMAAQSSDSADLSTLEKMEKQPIRTYELSISSASSECSVVDFDGTADPSDPLNWTALYKWSLVILISFLSLVVYVGISSLAPSRCIERWALPVC